jgi:tetratricopeptide (TPR) repeat protein
MGRGLQQALAAEGVEEERARLLPLALDRPLRHVHHGCRLFDREPAEEAQLDDSRRTLAQGLELRQRVIEQHEFFRPLGERQALLVERQGQHAAATLLRRLCSRVIDADLTHGAAGDRKEVPAVAPLRTRRAEKLEVGLVHERGRLERVAVTGMTELAMRQRSQLRVDDRKQPVERVVIPFADRDQQACDLSRIRGRLVAACHPRTLNSIGSFAMTCWFVRNYSALGRPRMDTPFPEPGWLRIEAVLDEALDLPIDRRRALLERVGREDPALQERVEQLLAADAAAGTFLDDGAAAWLRSGPLTPAYSVEEGALDAGARVGPYRVIHELGRGGMGIVYRAERADGEFVQGVALKLVRRGFDGDDSTARFRRERQILAQLDHRSIARLLDGGLHTDGRPYFAMELVEGEPITTYCDRRSLTIDARVRLFCQVCDAVQYAHGRLIVHRDLKPANIFVTTDGDLKLLDFGIAKLLTIDEAIEATKLTRTGLRPLTPAYAAPEQLRGEPVSTATDVYTLGVILFELVTARRPPGAASGFEGSSIDAEPPRPSDVVRRRDHGAPSIDEIAHARGTAPRALAARLAGDLDAIVLKALRREPQRRYVGAGALAEDLDRFLQGRPVAARPEGRRYRAGKFVRRHRVGLAVAVTLVLSLVGGLAGTAWQARLKTLEARKAEAVKAFLISIVQGADPAQAAGRDITLRQVLDQGADRVQRDLPDQPAVQGELLTVLAGVYAELGGTERAAALTDQALAIHERLYGADSPFVATNLRQKATLALARSDADTADRFARAALEKHRRAYGNLHPEVAEDLEELANAARQRGRLADAQVAAEESLRIRKAIYGNEHTLVAGSLNNLAVLRREQGRYEESAALYNQTIDLRRRLLGREHPRVALTVHNFAALQLFRGDLEQAAASAQEALEQFRRFYGEDHPLTLTARNNLANIDRVLGRYDAADAGFRSVLDSWARTQGADHPDAVIALASLGRIYRERGDLARAEETLRDADERWHRRMGAAPPAGAIIRRNLGGALADRGELDEAGRLLREVLARMHAAYGPSHLEVAETLFELGQLARRRGDPAEAESRLGEALAIRRKLLGERHYLTAKTLAALGAARLAGNDPASARQPLEDALVILRRSLPASHLLVVSATRDLERARQIRKGG